MFDRNNFNMISSCCESSLLAVYNYESSVDNIAVILQDNYFTYDRSYPIDAYKAFLKSGDSIIVKDNTGDVYDLSVYVDAAGNVISRSCNFLMLQTIVPHFTTPQTLWDIPPRGYLKACTGVLQGLQPSSPTNIRIVNNGAIVMGGSYFEYTTNNIAVFTYTNADLAPRFFDGSSYEIQTLAGSAVDSTIKINSLFYIPRQRLAS